MVLSRFWLIIFISSIVFIVTGVFTSRNYSIDFVLNGKKDDPVLIGEKYLNQLPNSLRDSLVKSTEGSVVVNVNDKDPDTTYVYKNQTVQVYTGVQKSDGLLETCKNSLTDLILPLIAYLAFFCGIM
ncbi:MAG: spore maturation protein, partial [Crocinitomicaceae bacterium]